MLVGHSKAVWIQTERPLPAERARELLAAAPGLRVDEFPTPGKAAGIDDVLVGRIRPDPPPPSMRSRSSSSATTSARAPR